MKLHKIISVLIIAVWALAACTASFDTPAPVSDFRAAAQYTFGDYSFPCEIQLESGTVFVTPTATAAADTVLSCDGNTVTFARGEMVQQHPCEALDVTNPARLLWSVFDSVTGTAATPVQQESLTVYSGQCAAGAFSLSRNRDGSWNTLSVPEAGITVIFD
ncbi:MAG: hypothetical protein IJ168_01840 [Eubacterium sp.]|nr:hypothetical protein [Eubacterium sp.]